MLSGLKTVENSSPVIVEDLVVYGKETRANCRSANTARTCFRDTISVDRYMAMTEDPDMLELIRSRPKTSNLNRVNKSGPAVNEFGFDPDATVEAIPGAMRTQGQKLGSMTLRVAMSTQSRAAKEAPLRDKMFKDHEELYLCVGYDPKNKKNPHNAVKNRGTGKVDHLVAQGDLTLGKRTQVSDRRSLHALREHIEELRATLLNYTKDAKSTLDLKKLLKEYNNRIASVSKNLSKAAKDKDLTKILLKEHREMVLAVRKEYKVRREQQQKIKLANKRKRVIANTYVKPIHVKQSGKDLSAECLKDPKYVDLSGTVVTPDTNIPRVYEMHVPTAALK